MFGEAVVEVVKRLLKVQFRREGSCQGSFLCNVSEARAGRVCSVRTLHAACRGSRVLACPLSLSSVGARLWCWAWCTWCRVLDLSVAQQLSERRA